MICRIRFHAAFLSSFVTINFNLIVRV